MRLDEREWGRRVVFCNLERSVLKRRVILKLYIPFNATCEIRVYEQPTSFLDSENVKTEKKISLRYSLKMYIRSILFSEYIIYTFMNSKWS